MSEKTMREAINEAMHLEMERDPTVVLIGEDVRGGIGGTAGDDIEAYGGVLGVSKGLWTRFGSSRVIDTPISESAIAGPGPGPGPETRSG